MEFHRGAMVWAIVQKPRTNEQPFRAVQLLNGGRKDHWQRPRLIACLKGNAAREPSSWAVFNFIPYRVLTYSLRTDLRSS
jgi:hypothetical protein